MPFLSIFNPPASSVTFPRARSLSAFEKDAESRKDGKVVGTATIVVVPDGKSRTVTITMKNATYQGKKLPKQGSPPARVSGRPG